VGTETQAVNLARNNAVQRDDNQSQSLEWTTSGLGIAMITSTTTISKSARLNDEREFQRLVEDYLPLLRWVVYRMRQKLPKRIERDELHSIGLSGLVAAARRYEPSRRKSFAGYAATRIRGAILDELRRRDPMSRWSRTKAKGLESAISKLEQEQGEDYNQDALRVEMNMSEEELVGLMEEVRPVRLVSLDEVDARPEFREDSLHDDFGEDSLHDDFRDDFLHHDFGEDSLHDVIPDDCCVSALDTLERKEIISLLVERMAQLPELQKKVLAMYYYENMQLSEIAAIFGVTDARICQIRGQAVAVLRKYLTKLLAEP
jgi:RNA polymerase sigma factor for flagellar operon FliA